MALHSALAHQVRSYIQEWKRLQREAPGHLSPVRCALLFPRWLFSLHSSRSPLGDELPWLALDAIQQLGKTVDRTKRVFEYGAGGSTLYFLRRAAEVVTVEHDLDWGRRVTAAIEVRGYPPGQLLVIEPTWSPDLSLADNADPQTYASSDENFRGWSFRDYASSIDAYADRSFDIILIDGRARPSCFVHARPKLRPGGQIVWDNTERLNYQRTLASSEAEFQRLDIYGPVLGSSTFSQTSFLTRRTGSQIG